MRTLLVAGVALLFAQAAQAQQGPFRPNYGPGYRPGLSPYLNLLRGGDQSANYFLGTRPEVQRRQNAALFRGDIADLQGRTAGSPEEFAEAPAVRSGTYVYLNNTGGYFNNTGAYFATPGRPANSLAGPSAAPPRTGRRGASSGPRPAGR